MDIIEKAFTAGERFRNWEQLSRWLRAYAPRVNNVVQMIEATRRASADGLTMPDNADEVRWIIRKYERFYGRTNSH